MESKKILVKIALCKLVEGFFILLGAAALVKFIDTPTKEFLLELIPAYVNRP